MTAVGTDNDREFYETDLREGVRNIGQKNKRQSRRQTGRDEVVHKVAGTEKTCVLLTSTRDSFGRDTLLPVRTVNTNVPTKCRVGPVNRAEAITRLIGSSSNLIEGNMSVIEIFFTIVTVIIFIAAVLNAPEGEPSDNDRDGQRLRGEYYVIYDTGERTERMNYRVAKDYAAIFGGKVYRYQESDS